MLRFLSFVCFALISALSLAQPLKPAGGTTSVRFEVEGRGEFVIQLYTKEAPKTTAHIIGLVQKGFYNGLKFHRADRTPKPYLVQTGDPATRSGDVNDAAIGSGGSGARIPYEDTGYQNVEGAVGLARIVDDKESGDSQFYILLGTSKFLDGHYTVFGKVVSGMQTVKSIQKGDRISAAQIVSG